MLGFPARFEDGGNGIERDIIPMPDMKAFTAARNDPFLNPVVNGIVMDTMQTGIHFRGHFRPGCSRQIASLLSKRDIIIIIIICNEEMQF